GHAAGAACLPRDRGFLLHAADRHLSGAQWPADHESRAQGADRANRRRDPRQAQGGRDGRRPGGLVMHRRALTKPDGRSLVLYGREPVDEHIEAPAAGAVTAASSHLRWHPLRGEWVVYAGHRQHRTFLPPAEWNPLAPSTDPAHPTEVPGGRWDVAVFDNLFSALGSTVPPPQEIVATAPGLGTTEVVVFTQDPKASLGSLALDHIALIIEVCADRTRVLAAREDVAYVLPFENRGVEVGVTLHHPHGQVYAYP